MDASQYLILEKKDAAETAIKLLRRKAEMMKEEGEKLLREVGNLEQVVLGSETSSARFSDRFNWAINTIENVIRNLNFAEFARAQAKLEVLDKK